MIPISINLSLNMAVYMGAFRIHVFGYIPTKICGNTAIRFLFLPKIIFILFIEKLPALSFFEINQILEKEVIFRKTKKQTRLGLLFC